MTWTRATLADAIGDRVVYRNLEPQEPGLPGLRESWADVGLDHYYVPRKTDNEYASALVFFLREAQRARGVTANLERLLFVGDTLMLDGSAAHNVGRHLPLRGFICAERPQEQPHIEIQDDLMVANRWGAVSRFLTWVQDGFATCDEHTALLVDLDKTLLGARGRNDKSIDAARVQAILRTMQAALGSGLQEAAFREIYDALNVPAYHRFTADNQDYLAYVCLMVMGGVCPPEELWPALRGGALGDIQQFVAQCEQRRGRMSSGLLAAHEEVRQGLAVDDPTPFKAFRRREYLETVGRMDVLPGNAPEREVLAREIVITAEVATLAREMSALGVLVFGISDKPDEASLPTADLVAQGYRPLHRTIMKVFAGPD